MIGTSKTTTSNESEDSNERNHFALLPDNIKIKIFSTLENKHFKNVPTVCKKWHGLSNNRHVLFSRYADHKLPLEQSKILFDKLVKLYSENNINAQGWKNLLYFTKYYVMNTNKTIEVFPKYLAVMKEVLEEYNVILDNTKNYTTILNEFSELLKKHPVSGFDNKKSTYEVKILSEHYIFAGLLLANLISKHFDTDILVNCTNNLKDYVEAKTQPEKVEKEAALNEYFNKLNITQDNPDSTRAGLLLASLSNDMLSEPKLGGDITILEGVGLSGNYLTTRAKYINIYAQNIETFIVSLNDEVHQNESLNINHINSLIRIIDEFLSSLDAAQMFHLFYPGKTIRDIMKSNLFSTGEFEESLKKLREYACSIEQNEVIPMQIDNDNLIDYGNDNSDYATTVEQDMSPGPKRKKLRK